MKLLPDHIKTGGSPAVIIRQKWAINAKFDSINATAFSEISLLTSLLRDLKSARDSNNISAAQAKTSEYKRVEKLFGVAGRMEND